MNPCFAYNSSLKFVRNFFGVAALFAFLLKSQELVLALGIVMAVAAISLKYNLIYQLHFRVLRQLLGQKDEPVAKDSGELSFAWAMGASFLLIPSLLFYLHKWPTVAWALVLMDAMLLLLAGIGGLCVASIMYAVLVKMWLPKKRQ
jgi:hypothetical protein